MRHWTEHEINQLKHAVGILSQEEIAALMNREKASVNSKIYALGLNKPMNYWQLKEDKLIRKLAGTMPVKEIAKKLGRKEHAVRCRASKLGVSLRYQSPKRGHFKYSFEDVEMARELSETYGISAAEIARKFEVPEETVRDWLRYKNRAYV